MTFPARLHDETPLNLRGFASEVWFRGAWLVDFKTYNGTAPVSLSFETKREALVAKNLIPDILSHRWPTCLNGCHVPTITNEHGLIRWAEWRMVNPMDDFKEHARWNASMALTSLGPNVLNPLIRCPTLAGLLTEDGWHVLSSWGLHPVEDVDTLGISPPSFSRDFASTVVRSVPLSIRFRSTETVPVRWDIRPDYVAVEVCHDRISRRFPVPVVDVHRAESLMTSGDIEKLPKRLTSCPHGCHLHLPVSLNNGLSRRHMWTWKSIVDHGFDHCVKSGLLLGDRCIIHVDFEHSIPLPDLSPVNDALRELGEDD